MQQKASIIYNVTNKVSNAIHTNWLQWMKEEHIPAVLATKCFINAVLLRLKDVDEEEGPTYAIQYYVANEADYKRYISEFSAELRKQTIDKWGDQFIAFRTVMEIVN